MSNETSDADRLQEPALHFAREDFPIIRDSLTVGEALNIIRQDDDQGREAHR